MLVERAYPDEADPLIRNDTRSLAIASANDRPCERGREDILAGAIFERCVTDANLIDRRSCFRKIALAVSVLTSLSAGAGFFPISLRLPAGFLFAAANFIGFFKLDIWAIRGTIGDLLGPRTEKEIVLLDRASSGKCFQVAVVTASAVIALLSQLPVALPALDYDGKLGIPAAACLLVGGMLLPIRSLQLSISKTIQTWKNNTKQTKEIEQLRATMGSMIDQRRDLFRKTDCAGQIAQANRFRDFQGSAVEKTNQFIEAAMVEPSEAAEGSISPSYSSRIARILGLWIAGSLQTGLAIYTFEKTKEHIVNNNALAGILAGSVVLSGVYLSGKSILDTTEKITTSCLGMIRGQREKTIAERLRPKLTRSLKLLGLAVDLGALGATTVIWGDFYQNNISLKAYFTSTLCLAYFLFLSTSTLDMVNEVVEELVQNKGTQEEQEIIELNCKFKKMQKLIESSSVSDLGVFVRQRSNQLKARLLEKTGLSTEKFDELVLSLEGGN